MGGQRRRRSIGKVDMLPDVYRTAVQEMLLGNRVSYKKICEYLAENGHEMSQMSISNYARKYLDQMQMVNMAQENLRMISEIMEVYPELDATEALIRLSSQQALNTLAEMPEEKWKEMDADALMRQISALVRAAAYKSRIDSQNRDEYERGLETIKGEFFNAMAQKDPKLYKQVSSFLNKEAAEG
jgi:hypothetical protein